MKRSPPFTVIDPEPVTGCERIVVPLKTWSPVSSVTVLTAAGAGCGPGAGSPPTRKDIPLRVATVPPAPPVPAVSALPPETSRPGDVRSPAPPAEKDPAGPPLLSPPQPEM